MAELDAGIISQIPDMGPNPVKAQQDAYSLYDSKNRVQMNALTLQDAKENQADRLATKKILQSSNLSTDKGVNDAAEKIKSVSPDLAMKFKQDMTAQKGQNLDLQLKQIQVAQEQQLPMLSAMDQTIRELQPMKDMVDTGKYTKADLDAMVARKMMPQIQQLSKEHPELAPYLNKYLQNPKALTYDALITQEIQSKQGREMMKQHEQEIKDAMGERRAAQTDRRLDIQTQTMLSQNARRDQLNKNDKESHITPETAELMAEQYLAGDKSVLTGLGRTKGDMAMARNAITAVARKKGMDGPAIASQIAKFQTDLAELRKIGNITGGVEFATGELNQFIPQVLETSENLPRGKFVPYTKAVQNWEKYTSDPKLRDFYVAVRSVMNAYDVLAARGGSDTAKREENRQMLATADSKEVVRTVMYRMKKELEAASQGGTDAEQAVTDRIAGKPAAAKSNDEDILKPPKKTSKTAAPKKDAAPAGPLSDDDLVKHYADGQFQ